MAGGSTCSSSGCIKSKEGTIIVEKHKILERWIEYIEELFHDDRGGKPQIPKNMDGPKILRSEGTSSIEKDKKTQSSQAR